MAFIQLDYDIWFEQFKPITKLGTDHSFKAGEDWRRSSSFHKSDLPKLIDALGQAENRCGLARPMPRFGAAFRFAPPKGVDF